MRSQLEHGADANAMTDHGFTALDWAARFGQVEAMHMPAIVGLTMARLRGDRAMVAAVTNAQR